MVAWDPTYGSPALNIPLNFTGSGDQIIVGGTAGFKITIFQFFFIVSAPVTLIFKSGTTALTGPLPFLANGAQVQDFFQMPLTCNDADPFIINASTSVTLGGTLWYAKPPSIQ